MMRFKKGMAFLIFISLLISLLSVVCVAEDSQIIYRGGAQKFVFVDDNDLFDNFRGLMPGDSVTQTITIKSMDTQSDYVKIYLRAEPHDEENNPLSDKTAETETIDSMTDFLSQLSMKVWNGNKLIYNASPDKLEGLAYNILLGAFSYQDTATLKIQLDIPVTLGNEFQYATGEIDWIFTAEEISKQEYKNTLVAVSGSKYLDGEAPVDEVYNFALLNDRGEVIQTTTNFKQTVLFEPMELKPGVHVFSVCEIDGGDEDIIYDPSIFKTYIEVKEDGTWEAKYYSDGASYAWFVFNNLTDENASIDDPVEPNADAEDDTTLVNGESTSSEDSKLLSWILILISVISVMLILISRKKRKED